MSQTIHAGCVAIGGRGILIAGPSGSGKSDLALRLIDRGAQLVSDDYTALRVEAGTLLGRAPPRIAGLIEIRGVGIVRQDVTAEAPICLLVDLAQPPERLPDGPGKRLIAGCEVPSLPLAALEASAPIKVERALLLFGLHSA